jgi:hypothetical protein
MGIVGDRPETGVRIDVERARDGEPPWRYAGQAVTPESTFGLEATVGADGTVGVALAAGAPPGLADKVRLLLRAAWKHADELESGASPPRHIVRWRPDR